MNLYLEQLLSDYCQIEHLDLDDRLERVKRSAREIWKDQRLWWFPDHKVSHSERVISHLADILAHLQETHLRLTPYELYVLLAACYLHDIGMQDFVFEGKRVEAGDFTKEIYEQVRRRHPQRSAQLIRGEVEPGLDIDLAPEPSYVIPISLVSQGHGSDFFEETAAKLAASPYRPGNKKLRGDLLTALLLMADELDLHEDRAEYPKATRLSPVTALHYYTHHYITGVEIVDGNTTKQRQIRLQFNYPRGSEEYSGDIRTRVVGKLQRQRRRTEPFMERTTDAEISWSDYIEVSESFDEFEQRDALPPAALAELKRQLAELNTVGYRPILDVFRDKLLRPHTDTVLCLVGEDDQAKAQMINWLDTHCACHHIVLFKTELRKSEKNPYGLIKHFHRFLKRRKCGRTYKSLWARQAEKRKAPIRSSERLSAIIKDFGLLAQTQSLILFFQHVDEADPSTTQWLEETFIPALREEDFPIPILLTRNALADPSEKQDQGWTILRLGNIDVKDLAEHLRRTFGFPSEEAGKEARKIHGTSLGGTPAGVIFALRQLQAEEVKFIT
jgi:hypothetical protein